MEINEQQLKKRLSYTRYILLGGFLGLIAAIILTGVTISMCDASCNENPVGILLFVSFPIFFIIGALGGVCWINRITRVIMLILLSLLIVWFLKEYIFEFSG